MPRISKLLTIPVEEFITKVKNSSCQTEALRSLEVSTTGSNTVKIFKEICEKYRVDINHFVTRSRSVIVRFEKESELKVKEWLDGKRPGHDQDDQYHIAKWARRWLLDRANHRCEKCGWNEINQYTKKIPLQIHHIDGVANNARPENLQVICPSCHSLTENFGNRNRNCVRRKRPPK